MDGAQLSNEIDARLARAAMLANGLGALVVIPFLMFLLPVTPPDVDQSHQIAINAVAIAVYVAVSFPLGLHLGRRNAREAVEWMRSGQPAQPRHRDYALRNPLVIARLSAILWAGAALVFGVLNALAAPELGAATAVTVLLGGLTTSAVLYLLAERILRPVVARALAGAPPPERSVPGVTARITMAWTLATGVPLLAITAMGVADLAGADLDKSLVTWATVFLAVTALGVGLLGIVVAARAVADPLAALRGVAARVQEGDFEARVRVDDGSEIGLLEAGFNRMVEGLAERERLRDAFGRHVGEEVARAALDGEVKLGGEVREVAALFVDLVGSTSLAAARPPTEVVALLNDFFGLVVESVERHGGWVNKFEGDAALCVFGAPIESRSAAADALAAARELRARLEAELPGVDAGIGVSAGPAVAGNIGSEHRLEYTVIGDPVNEAARLCELAKREPGRVLASEAALDRAARDEVANWLLGDEVTLRGRPEPTRLATVAR